MLRYTDESFGVQSVPIEFSHLNKETRSPNYGHLVPEQNGKISAFRLIIIDWGVFKKVHKGETRKPILTECHEGFTITRFRKNKGGGRQSARGNKNLAVFLAAHSASFMTRLVRYFVCFGLGSLLWATQIIHHFFCRTVVSIVTGHDCISYCFVEFG